MNAKMYKLDANKYENIIQGDISFGFTSNSENFEIISTLKEIFLIYFFKVTFKL